MKYQELKDLYHKKFSLCFLGKDITNKIGLISLICYLTEKTKKDYPNIKVTYEKVIDKLTKDTNLTSYQKVALTFICEDFSYGCDNFPLFGVKEDDVIDKIKDILKESCPF